MPTPQEEYRTIPLTQGQLAIVDSDDFERLSQWKWFARFAKHTGTFYAVRSTRRENGRQTPVLMHREVLGLKSGDGMIGDHRSGDTLDNRKCNLRIATHMQNSHNRRKQSSNTTGFKGVSKWGKRFKATIRINGKLKYLGIADSAEAAYALYCVAARQYHGEFSHL